MTGQLQITLRDIGHSPALESRIQRSAQRLSRFCPGILSCRVVVEAPHHHQHQGRQFVVRLEVKVPGAEIVVNHDHHEDPYVALRDAFSAARRQLEDHARRQRGEVKTHRRDSRAGVESTADE